VSLPDREDDLELELRRLPSVLAVGLIPEEGRLLVELAIANGISVTQIASVRERAELLARGAADEVTVRVLPLATVDTPNDQ
jgi:hypothetical protein